MTILARYSGTCLECGERWEPGDLICGADNELPYEQRRRPTIWRHVTCPESVEKAEGAVCDHCFLRRSLTGECGCDQ